MKKNLREMALLGDAAPRDGGAPGLDADKVVVFPRNRYGELVRLRDILVTAFLDVIGEKGRLILTIDPGSKPRLWIDQLAWIDTCSGGTAFRLTLKTRDGHQTLLETDKLPMLADFSAHYIAARIHRSRELENLL